MWGISNELHQMSDEIYGIYTELNELANAEDNTRLITFADSQFWGVNLGVSYIVLAS